MFDGYPPAIYKTMEKHLILMDQSIGKSTTVDGFPLEKKLYIPIKA